MENNLIFTNTKAFKEEKITPIKLSKLEAKHLTVESKILKIYNSYLSEFDSKRIGYGTAGLFVQSSLGGIAAMVILGNHSSTLLKMIELFIVTLFAMSYNASFMINLKVKTVFNLLIGSVIICIFMIALNLI